ncbi:MAG: flavodoxin family protein [Chloroflexi bacterium]|nr:flavodoxin family protein [Chloroflexota bacterium]
MICVLGIAASPRRWGNTAIMLKAFLAGAESQGAAIKQISASSIKIDYCEHCDKCFSSGECVKQDDMNMVNEDLAWADIIVIASPIYFAGVPAQIKTLIDRGQSNWVRKYILATDPLYPPKERRGYILAAGGRDRNDIFDCIKEEISTWFISHNIKFFGMETASNLNTIDGIKGRPEALERMFSLGKRAVTDCVQREDYKRINKV